MTTDKNQERPALPVRRSGACPDDPEDTVERYLLHLLAAREAERFEAHYLACENCVACLKRAEHFMAGMRAACASQPRTRLT